MAQPLPVVREAVPPPAFVWLAAVWGMPLLAFVVDRWIGTFAGSNIDFVSALGSMDGWMDVLVWAVGPGLLGGTVGTMALRRREGVTPHLPTVCLGWTFVILALVLGVLAMGLSGWGGFLLVVAFLVVAFPLLAWQVVALVPWYVMGWAAWKRQGKAPRSVP